MSSADKEIYSHEVGLDPSQQDDRDMERLGKTQQFKVRQIAIWGSSTMSWKDLCD